MFGPWGHGLAPVLLGCNVSHGLAELPSMPGEVFEGAVPLAVLPVRRRLQHPGPPSTGSLEAGVDVVDPHPELVRHDIGLRWPALACDVGHDHRRVGADGHLGAVALADAGPFDEAERGRQLRHRGPHVRVDEDRDDRGRRHGPVAPHRRLPSGVVGGGQVDIGFPISQ